LRAVLIAVTTTGKIALAVAAGLFIVFAIASSFYFPRRDPDYPGNRLGAFVALTVLLFVALLGAMVAFAGESEEEHAAGETSTHAVTETTGTTTGETETGETETGETETGETETDGNGGGEGDAAAGESIFADNGCGSCHTLEAAGASGSIGPNLDEAKPDFELAVDRVTNGSGAMPSFGDSLDEQQIRDVAAYVVESTQ
jgi:mono/diheme cytochrome c family protein